MFSTCPDAAGQDGGFTLIELLVVVAIIGILSTLGLPAYADYKRKAYVAHTAADMRNFATAFVAYEMENDSYPVDNHLVLPPGLETFIASSYWTAETPIGGYYNWEGPNFYPYAGISIFAHTASNEDLTALDRMLDNGNLNTGRFRWGTNGRPTYIVEDGI